MVRWHGRDLISFSAGRNPWLQGWLFMAKTGSRKDAKHGSNQPYPSLGVPGGGQWWLWCVPQRSTEYVAVRSGEGQCFFIGRRHWWTKCQLGNGLEGWLPPLRFCVPRRLLKEPFEKLCVKWHQCAGIALPPSPFLGLALLGASLSPTCVSLESGSVQPSEKAGWWLTFCIKNTSFSNHYLLWDHFH